MAWTEVGTSLFLEHAERLSEEDLRGPSALPGWTLKHLLAHIASNADALSNLVQWARTGEPRPMYASSGQRAADIEAGASRPRQRLLDELRRSAENLTSGLEVLNEQAWANEVVTAQGRTVPATEIPWLRAREVCVHAVDLDTGVSFADLPESFLDVLIEEIRVKRGLTSLPVAPLPTLAAYLAGRPHPLLDAQELGPWL
jgi:maleylpyruvate isomerase